jgi:hypothetical protein
MVDPTTIPSVVPVNESITEFTLRAIVTNVSKRSQNLYLSPCPGWNFVADSETFWAWAGPCNGGVIKVTKILHAGDSFEEQVRVLLFKKDPIGLHRFKLGLILRPEHDGYVNVSWSDLLVTRTDSGVPNSPLQPAPAGGE